MRKTGNRQSPIIKFFERFEIILICSSGLKPGEPTKSVYIWQASGIRYLEILCIPVADHRLNICRDRRSTQKTIDSVHPKKWRIYGIFCSVAGIF